MIVKLRISLYDSFQKGCAAMFNWAFWGGFLAVALVLTVTVLVLRSKIRNFSRKVFGKPDLLEALSEVESIEDNSPRSLNGCDALLLPQILADFPDFDISLAKTYARNYLKDQLRDKQSMTIYNVVIARYLRSATQRTIVFQAALSYYEGSEKQQKRYELDYAHMLSTVSDSVAANCPNCGGALGYGVTTCPYCGSRVANVLGNTWQFTELRER